MDKIRSLSDVKRRISDKVYRNPWPWMVGVAVVFFIAGYEVCSAGAL